MRKLTFRCSLVFQQFNFNFFVAFWNAIVRIQSFAWASKGPNLIFILGYWLMEGIWKKFSLYNFLKSRVEKKFYARKQIPWSDGRKMIMKSASLHVTSLIISVKSLLGLYTFLLVSRRIYHFRKTFVGETVEIKMISVYFYINRTVFEISPISWQTK